MDYLSELMRSFREIKRTYHNIVQKDAEKVGITGVQLVVLRILSENEQINLGELAQRLKITNSSLSGIIDRLVQANLIIRDRSKQDRRALILTLTPEGENVVKVATGPDSHLYKKINRILEIPEEDLKNLLRIHNEILHKLTSGEDEEND